MFLPVIACRENREDNITAAYRIAPSDSKTTMMEPFSSTHVKAVNGPDASFPFCRCFLS